MNYGYIRFSVGKQERGSSIARQKELINKLCPDIATENIFEDKGVSAFKGANLLEGSQWHKLMSVVKSGDCIFLEQIDRVTRQGLKKALDIISDLRLIGVSVVTTFDGKKYQGGVDTTLEEGITLMLAGELGKNESANKSRRVASSYVDRNNRAAKNKEDKIKIPLASWLDYDNGKYKLNHRSDTVKDIFEMCIGGTGAAAIAIELNKRNVKPFKYDKKEEKAKREGKELEEEEEGKEAVKLPLWGAASVFVILRNKSTYGVFTPSAWKIREAKRTGEVFENTTTEIADYFPPVITEHTYYAAQEALRIRRNTRATKQTREDAPFNLYQGVAQCACGSRLHVMAKGKAKQRYLVCAGKVRNDTGCTAGNIREDIAETIFRELLTKVNVVELLENKRVDVDVAQLELELAKARGLHEQAEDDLAKNGYNSSIAAYLRTTAQEIGQLEHKLTLAKESNLQAVMLLEDKQWLMSNILLQTREQRYRANMLLKKLNITVGMWRDVRTNDMTFHVEGVITYLLRDNNLQEIARSVEVWDRLKQHNPHIGYGMTAVGRLHLEGKHKEANELKQKMNKIKAAQNN